MEPADKKRMAQRILGDYPDEYWQMLEFIDQYPGPAGDAGPVPGALRPDRPGLLLERKGSAGPRQAAAGRPGSCINNGDGNGLGPRDDLEACAEAEVDGVGEVLKRTILRDAMRAELRKRAVS